MNELDRAISAIRSGDKERGCRLLTRWAKRHPEQADVHQLLGCTLASLGRKPDALAALKFGVEANSRHALLRFNLGTLLLECGQPREALQQLLAAVEQDPTHAGAWNNLCATARKLGELAISEQAGRRATEIEPTLADAWVNLGNTFKDQSRTLQAIEAYEMALAVNPEPSNVSVAARSNALLARCYIEHDPASLAKAHQAFGAWLTSAISERPLAEREANIRTRVGYVSGEFLTHSVAFFFGSLLNSHDRHRFDICLYSDVKQPDAVTELMEKSATEWTDATAMSDEDLWAKIRADRIDVLVDLSGHTGHRLGVFARRAAPVQVTWLGYPFSTGLPAMDYRITDGVADPPEADQWHSERLLRLPGPFLCYQPPLNAPEVAPAPALRNGFITFGSFNNLAKLTEDTVVLYSAILQSCPDSRLLLKARPLRDVETCNSTIARFVQYGISPQRLTLRGHESEQGKHLATYADIDLVLDPVPYNGTTTTFEALWMGVPVLTLRGGWHASRVGASIMANLGLSAFVTETPEALVTLAHELSTNFNDVAQLRQVLRQVLQMSPLCDQVRYARAFEAALLAAIDERAAPTKRESKYLSQ